MKRWLHNLLAGVSLVLGVAAALLWLRSYFVSNVFQYSKLNSPARTFTVYYICSARGEIFFQRMRWIFTQNGLAEKAAIDVSDMFPEGLTHGAGLPDDKFEWSPKQHIWNRLGFGFGDYGPQPDLSVPYSTTANPQFDDFCTGCCPYWFVVLLTAAMPLRAFLLRLKHRRQLRDGQCLGCGYDLRATPERCPECGMVPAQKKIIST